MLPRSGLSRGDFVLWPATSPWRLGDCDAIGCKADKRLAGSICRVWPRAGMAPAHFAERELWNIEREFLGSLRLDAGELYDLGPLLGFIAYELTELTR
jgi:hypothetical protein